MGFVTAICADGETALLFSVGVKPPFLCDFEASATRFLAVSASCVGDGGYATESVLDAPKDDDSGNAVDEGSMGEPGFVLGEWFLTSGSCSMS